MFLFFALAFIKSTVRSQAKASGLSLASDFGAREFRQSFMLLSINLIANKSIE
jgi:hypothetical protein